MWCCYGYIHSTAFLLLYGIALAIEGWGVVASLKIYPPFAGAAVSAITLVVAFGFAVSQPCLTLEVCTLITNPCAIQNCLFIIVDFFLWLRSFSLHLLIILCLYSFLCLRFASIRSSLFIVWHILYNQMMEDAVHFLSKETVVQAIARSATKVLHFSLDLSSCASMHHL